MTNHGNEQIIEINEQRIGIYFEDRPNIGKGQKTCRF